MVWGRLVGVGVEVGVRGGEGVEEVCEVEDECVDARLEGGEMRDLRLECDRVETGALWRGVGWQPGAWRGKRVWQADGMRRVKLGDCVWIE